MPLFSDDDYRLYSSILRSRLQLVAEQFLGPTQFGFRAGRSVSQPIHIIRQLLQAHEFTISHISSVSLIGPKLLTSFLAQCSRIPRSLTLSFLSTHLQPLNFATMVIFAKLLANSAGGSRADPLSLYFFILDTFVLFDHVELQTTCLANRRCLKSSSLFVRPAGC